jgi:flagellin
MAAFINTNTASLNAQRNLNSSQGALATSLQRLSSGLRINSAKDDAAGSAISERMTSQIRGSDQAARNANDGISLAQTAEGDLGSIGTNLQRMRELTVQSSNASNSSSDRAALQNEVVQLREEIDRVAANSSFNGVKLLDGSFSSQTFQVGANNTSNDKITIANISSSRTASLGVSYSASVSGTGATTAALTAGSITINGTGVNASVAGNQNGQSAASAFSIAQAINSSSTGVTATAGATSAVGATTITGTSSVAAGALTINGVSVGAIAGAASVTLKGDNVAAAINLVSAASGVTASNAAGVITLTAADGREIAAAGAAAAIDTGVTPALTTQGVVSLAITGSSNTNSNITVAGSVAAAGLAAVTTAGTQGGKALSIIDISSVAGAGTALAAIDSALSSINTSKASLGAYQNRFASVVSNLQTTSENLSASRSRIQDTDFAHETASLTRGQILQQAGTAMLAQANSLPNGVLALLRG